MWIGFESTVEPGEQPDEVFNDIARLIDVCRATGYYSQVVPINAEPFYQVSDDAARDEILKNIKK